MEPDFTSGSAEYAIRRAISEPGSLVPRRSALEPMEEWQARAVLAIAGTKVHYQWPPVCASGRTAVLEHGELWSGDLDHVTCMACQRADARAAVLREVAGLAREHGAFYFAEPRPCRCKPGCAMVTSQRMPFADLLLNLKGDYEPKEVSGG
jgi:hypothetical protein